MAFDLLSMFPDELSTLCVELGQPKYRGKQIFEGLYKGVRDANDFSSLPKQFREKLGESAFIPTAKIRRKLVSAIDGTVKYLYELHDGETVESVFMRYHHGNTMCILREHEGRIGAFSCTFGNAFTDNRSRARPWRESL